MFQHNCIKCRAVYQDSDEEAYLCMSCNNERKAVAAQIDAQFSNRPRVQVKSALQEFDEMSQAQGGKKVIDGREVTFVRA